MARVIDLFDHKGYFTQPISRRSIAQQQVNAYKGARSFVQDRILLKYSEHQQEHYGCVLLEPRLNNNAHALMTYKGMESARNSSCSLMGSLCSRIFIEGYRRLFRQYIHEESHELSLVDGSKRRHIDFKLALPGKDFYFSVKSTTRERAPNAWKAELTHLHETTATNKPWSLVGVFYEAGLDWPVKTIQEEIEKIVLDVDSQRTGSFAAVGICDTDAHVRFISNLSMFL